MANQVSDSDVLSDEGIRNRWQSFGIDKHEITRLLAEWKRDLALPSAVINQNGDLHSIPLDSCSVKQLEAIVSPLDVPISVLLSKLDQTVADCAGENPRLSSLEVQPLPQFLYRTPWEGLSPNSLWARKQAGLSPLSILFTPVFYDQQHRLRLLIKKHGKGTEAVFSVAGISCDQEWSTPLMDVVNFEYENEISGALASDEWCPPGVTRELVLKQIPCDHNQVNTEDAVIRGLQMHRIRSHFLSFSSWEEGPKAALFFEVAKRFQKDFQADKKVLDQTTIRKYLNVIDAALERISEGKPPLRP